VLRPAVDLLGVVVRVGAAAAARVVHAGGEAAVPGRQPVRSGERAEVLVERPVLLHDHDDVLDAVDTARAPDDPDRARHDAQVLRGTASPAARQHCQRDHEGNESGAHAGMVARADEGKLKRLAAFAFTGS
jgi:hypothetical protein